MALVKTLKLNTTTGRPRQHDSVTDEINFLTVQGGNLKIGSNTLSSEDTNGNINVEPNGSGDVVMQSLTYPSADGSAGQNLQTDGAGTLSFGDDTIAQKVCNDYTADEILIIVDALYISAADNVSKADASAESTARLMGFAAAAAADTTTVSVCSEGLLGGFSALTPGATYFLSETAGLITTTPPSTDDSAVVQVGYAKSATEIQIHIEQVSEIDTD